MNVECLCPSDTISMEILMLVLGAVLGLFASLFVMIVQRILDKKGKLNVFNRFSYQKGMGGATWGFEESSDGRKYFVIPVIFEFPKTSNTRMLKDRGEMNSEYTFDWKWI